MSKGTLSPPNIHGVFADASEGECLPIPTEKTGLDLTGHETPMQSAASRQFFLYPLTIVKGACILAIVVLHVTDSYALMSRHDLLRAAVIFVHSLARFGMPLFIVFSGFYISLNVRNDCPGPFYRRTLRFLVVPYFVYALFYSAPVLLRHGDLWLFVRRVLALSYSSHLYFVLLIVQLYLLHPYLSRWYRTREHRGMLVIASFALQILWSVSMELLCHSPDALLRGVGVGARRLFPGFIGYFLGGYYLLEHSEEAVRWMLKRGSACVGGAIWVVTAGVMAVFVDIAMLREPPPAGSVWRYLASGLLVPLMSLAALVVVLHLARSRRPGQGAAHRLLSSLGLYSYGVYYLHPFFLIVSGAMLGRGAGLGPGDAFFYVPVLVLTTLVTLFTVRFLARLPFGRYLT